MPAAAPATLGPSHRLAWLIAIVLMAIALAIVVQAIVLLLARDSVSIPAKVGSRVTWSVIVCGGIAAVACMRRRLPALAGLVGLLATPLALQAAKVVQKGLAGGTMAPSAAVPGPMETMVGRSVEYAVLAVIVVAWARGRGLRAHLLAGAGVGAAFTVYSLARMIGAAEATPPALAMGARVASELLHPLGCAAVLWAAPRIGQALAARSVSANRPAR